MQLLYLMPTAVVLYLASVQTTSLGVVVDWAASLGSPSGSSRQTAAHADPGVTCSAGTLWLKIRSEMIAVIVVEKRAMIEDPAALENVISPCAECVKSRYQSDTNESCVNWLESSPWPPRGVWKCIDGTGSSEY